MVRYSSLSNGAQAGVQDWVYAGVAPACAVALDQDVEGAELDLVVMLAGVEGVEIGDAVDAEDHGFAIEDEVLVADLAGGLRDPRVTRGPVVAASGDQADAVPIALQSEAVAIVFYLWSQSGPAGTVMALVARQNSKGLNILPR